MLNTCCTLLQALVRNRLHKELDNKGGLHPHQYAFRKGKSTLDEFNSRWRVVITIDIRNAFNLASHKVIIGKLRKREVST